MQSIRSPNLSNTQNAGPVCLTHCNTPVLEEAYNILTLFVDRFLVLLTATEANVALVGRGQKSSSCHSIYASIHGPWLPSFNLFLPYTLFLIRPYCIKHCTLSNLAECYTFPLRHSRQFVHRKIFKMLANLLKHLLACSLLRTSLCLYPLDKRVDGYENSAYFANWLVLNFSFKVFPLTDAGKGVSMQGIIVLSSCPPML